VFCYIVGHLLLSLCCALLYCWTYPVFPALCFVTLLDISHKRRNVFC
jgi:hypothetical protein